MDVASKVTVEDDEERVAIVVAGHVWIRFRELNAVAGKSDIRFPEQMVMQGAPRRTATQTGIRVDTNTFKSSDQKSDANPKNRLSPVYLVCICIVLQSGLKFHYPRRNGHHSGGYRERACIDGDSHGA